ncbi:Alanine racemase [hydrothermal vent metagenome]|uniref:Alanine racemase n=1 Tax=hydrothermal vent metagenome TaxID=652676 RepID=A0A3B0QSB5_9ZZZZ
MSGRPTVALIDTQALEYNLKSLKAKLPEGVATTAVVKANAYGHGAALVAETLQSAGCSFFGVAFAGEGAELRKGGITKPIIVFSGATPAEITTIIENNLTPVVYDIDSAQAINKQAEAAGIKQPVHIKIDSGMGRLGIQPGRIKGFFNAFSKLQNLQMEGLMSQYAEMDSEDKAFSKTQLATFKASIKEIAALGFKARYNHIANSAATVDCSESHLDMVRPGIMLYGAYPAPHFRGQIDLRPVMTLKTRIIQLKRVAPGTPVSYGRTFITDRESVIATLPVGYGDGLPRRLSSGSTAAAGKGSVLIRGRKAPIVGTICMDLMMVDVTGIEGVEQGDEAVIIGAQGAEIITAEEIAEQTGTISYEIFCNVARRVPRIAVRTTTAKTEKELI